MRRPPGSARLPAFPSGALAGFSRHSPNHARTLPAIWTVDETVYRAVIWTIASSPERTESWLTGPAPATGTASVTTLVRQPDNPGLTALYLERYLNYGLTTHELQGKKPIIGIAQTGSDLAPLQSTPHGAGEACP